MSSVSRSDSGEENNSREKIGSKVATTYSSEVQKEEIRKNVEVRTKSNTKTKDVEPQMNSSSDERSEEKQVKSKAAQDRAILTNSFKRHSLGKPLVNKDVEEMDSSFDDVEDGGHLKTKDKADNSLLTHSFKRRSVDKTSITMQKTIEAGEEKEKCVSDRIHKVVDLFCAGLKSKCDVSINVSLKYDGQVTDSEDQQSDLLEVSLVASDITKKSEKVVADNRANKRKICQGLSNSTEKETNLSNRDSSIKSPTVVTFSDIKEEKIEHKPPKKQEMLSEADEASNEEHKENKRSPKKKLKQTPFRSNLSENLTSSGCEENAGKTKKKLREKSKASDESAEKLKKINRKQKENEPKSDQLMRPETEQGKKTKTRKLANFSKSEDVQSPEKSTHPVFKNKKKKKSVTDLREKLSGKKASQQDASPLKPSRSASVGWEVTMM